jgi:surface protein
MSVSGTLIYTFTYTGSGDDVSTYVPIVNADTSFTFGTPTYTPSTTPATSDAVTVEIPFVFTDNGTTNDGLNFSSVNPFYTTSTTDLTITQFGSIPLARNGYQFQNLTSLTFTASDAPIILSNTSLSWCFGGCSNFNSSINGWTTTTVTDTSQMFRSCSAFNQELTIDTSSVTNMAGMFFSAPTFNNGGASGTSLEPLMLDTSSATNLSAMFYFCGAFNQPVSNFDTSNVTEMNNMFFYATAFNQSLSTFDTSLVTSLNNMFANASAFNQSLNSWNTSNVTTMDNMFDSSAYNQPLNSWDTSNVTSMMSTFSNAQQFNQPLNNWNTSNVTQMFDLFRNATAFNQNIGSWNTFSVTNMGRMFNGASAFNQNIGSWVTLSVTNMNSMFNGSTAFNQDLSGWYVPAIPSLPTDFATGAGFESTTAYYPNFGQYPDGFVYSFTYTGAGTDDLSTQLPLIRTGELVTGTIAYYPSATPASGSNVTIIIPFTFTDNGTTNDGLKFSSVNTFYADSTTGLTINQFGSIPLARDGSQFIQTSLTAFTASDTPTILSNTSMDSCFRYNYFFNSSINGWNTTNVTNMTNAFADMFTFNQELTFDTSNVTDMSYMLSGCNSFNNGDSSNVATKPLMLDTSSATVMTDMFRSSPSFNQELSNFNTSNVTNMSGMFQGAASFNQDVSSFDVSNVTDFTSMFFSATAFNNGDTPGSSNNPLTWTTTLASSFQSLFQATQFNQDVSSFDLTNVTNLAGTFNNCPFNNNSANNWNTSSVTTIDSMFYENSVFNQNISSWNTSNVTNMYCLFYSASAFNQNIGSWNTGNVTNFNGTFYLATAFNNGDTSGSSNNNLNFNTSSATTMERMFWSASAFNQNIGSWNTVLVTTMDNMFNSATVFNQDLSSWSVEIIPSLPTGFATGAGFESTTAYYPLFGEAPPPPPPCFKEGSKILCLVDGEEKYVPIENIRRGHLVKTFACGFKKVEVIGKSKLYNPANKLFSKRRLYKYSHAAHPEIAEGDDLIITSCHSVLVNKITAELREQIIELFGEIYVTEAKYRLPACLDVSAAPYEEEGVFTIWHLALENEVYNKNYGVYANGLLVESCSIRFLKEFSGMELIE